MKGEHLFLGFILFVLLALFARIEAIRIASIEWMRKKGLGDEVVAREVKLRHYVKGLALALGQTMLFVVLIPLAVVKYYKDRGKD